MGMSWRKWKRPLRWGILASLLSALLILPSSLWLADWQARQGERRELELLRQHTSQRIDAFFDNLQGSLLQTQALQFDECSDEARQRLQQQATGALFVEGVGMIIGGVLCSNTPIPTAKMLADYQHWRVGSVDIWWQPNRMQHSSYPSLVIGQKAELQGSTHQSVLLASSLRYLQQMTLLPEGVTGVVLGPEEQVMDLYGERKDMQSEEHQLLARPGTMERFAGRTYLLGTGKYDLHLLISRPETDFLTQRHLFQVLWLSVGLVMVVLIGRLVTIQLRHDQSLERALQLALRDNEFEVDYQPLVDLASGRCVGAEALVRWRRDDGQRVRPDLFIPQAEDSGQITDITQWVIKRVVKEQGAFLRAHPHLYISLNLAAADILDGGFQAVASKALREAGVPAGQLVYEVTERGLVDVERAVELLTRLREAGHRVAIDDFGTGYSSLSYLQHLPVDVLKIDKCFVDALGTEAASSPVAPHIISMAQALGLKVIAEGVERTEQAQQLSALGAQIGQGWLFAKPMEAQAFRAFAMAH